MKEQKTNTIKNTTIRSYQPPVPTPSHSHPYINQPPPPILSTTIHNSNTKDIKFLPQMR